MVAHPRAQAARDRVTVTIPEKMERKNREVVFIAGAGHSGSTLLGLALGAHPEIFYAGEANKSQLLADASAPLRKRTCKVCGEGCPVWTNLAWTDLVGTDLVGTDRERTDRVVGDDLYEALSLRTGRPVVVDSTKETGWIAEKSAALAALGVRVHLFFLGRDGRAIVASGLRKDPSHSVEEHTKKWVQQIAASEALAARFPGPVTRVRYETLVTEPEATLSTLVRSLDRSLVPSMLSPFDSEQHPLGGNAGTQSLLSGSVTRPSGPLPVKGDKRRYYEDHPRAFVLDQRWRSELSDEALRRFSAVAGQTEHAHAWEEETR
jgi:hypothetical protein